MAEKTDDTEYTVRIIWFDRTEGSTSRAEETLTGLVRRGWRIVAAGGGAVTAEQNTAGVIPRPGGFVVVQGVAQPN